MIAYVLRELGHDPAWIVGGVVGQLGGNAGTGEGWLVVEGDESDRSIGAPPPRDRRRDQRRARPPRRLRVDRGAADVLRRLAGCRAARRPRLGARAGSVRARVPGEHNRLNAAAALAALELAGVGQADAEAAARALRGVSTAASSSSAMRGGVRVYDDYGHNPTEIAATLRTARDLADGRLLAVYQPHVYERTRQLGHELGAALGLADAAHRHRRHRRPRPAAGCQRRLVLDRVPRGVAARLGADTRRRRHVALAWVRPGRRRRHARRGGAVESRGRSARVCRMNLDRGVPLARLTTIGTGGPAAALARPRSLAELERCSSLRARRRSRRRSGRARLEPAGRRRGRRGARDPARGRARRGRDRGRASARGGGAANAVCLHRARTRASADSSSPAPSPGPRAAA